MARGIYALEAQRLSAILGRTGNSVQDLVELREKEFEAGFNNIGDMMVNVWDTPHLSSKSGLKFLERHYAHRKPRSPRKSQHGRHVSTRCHA